MESQPQNPESESQPQNPESSNIPEFFPMEVQSSKRLARIWKCSFINIIITWYVSKFFYHQDINFHPWRYKVHKDWLTSRNVQLLILLKHGMFLSSFIIKISIFTNGGTKFTKTGSRLEMFYYY